MNSKQISKFIMGFSLRDFLNQNARIIATLPDFGKLFTVFSENSDKIRIIKEAQGTDKTGVARLKEQLRADLIEKALDISRRTSSYAKMTHNVVLENEVHFSPSGLKMSPTNILMDHVPLIHDRAEANLTALEVFGVTADALAALKNTFEQFILAIPKPRLSIVEKKKATEQLTALFQANDELLKQMDALVEIVRKSEPDFFSAYWSARRIINAGRSSLALKATITDAYTHTGIKGVKVNFTQQNGQPRLDTAKVEKPMIKRTTSKGRFTVKSMPTGSWTATLVKPGFKEKVVTLTVADNERTDLKVELERN